MSNLNLKGIWIPIAILTDDKLSDKEKIIYAIIIYLSKENQYCFFTNGFKNISEITGTNAGINSWVLLTTGSTEQVKKQNLYDVAGNLWEWTMEASYVDNLDYNMNVNYNTYMLRGGGFNNAHASSPAVYRGYYYAPGTSTNNGFRATLYIK